MHSDDLIEIRKELEAFQDRYFEVLRPSEAPQCIDEAIDEINKLINHTQVTEEEDGVFEGRIPVFSERNHLGNMNKWILGIK